MHRTHKIRIYPNATQTKALYRLSGCIRYAYNWMLDKAIKDYEQGIKWDYYALRKAWRQHAKTIPFLQEVSRTLVTETASENLKNAFTKFLKKTAKFPKFHSKQRGIESILCYAQGIKYDADSEKIYVTTLGWLKLAIPLRYFYTKLCQVWISCRAGKWFCSICVEMDDDRECLHPEQSVGIDLGLHTLIMCSTGEAIPNNHTILLYARRLRIL